MTDDGYQVMAKAHLAFGIWQGQKTAHFVPIHKQTWPPQAIPVSDWSISKNLLL
jgi:hypothetical protein